MSDQPSALRSWHAVIESRDLPALDDLLADDVVFRSPVVFTPQEGKAVTLAYLTAAMAVLGPSLRYLHQWHDEASAVLEFEADLGGTYVQGVDMLRWNDEGKLVAITVLVRPMRGMQRLLELMAAELSAGST
ncbi:MAG TPA: nuclear transport factor 2 family protein [Streptosporangiaceae bacterium]